MASENVLEFTDQNFEQEVLNSSTPVLVDFWAEWCGPCRQLGPVIEKIASEYAGRVKVGKVDIESHRDPTIKYGVHNIPTVILFQGGKPVNKIVGYKPEKDFRNLLDTALGAATA